MVETCANITRSFCDLTDVWINLTETYIPRVVAFRENTALVTCMGSFFMATDSEFIPFFFFFSFNTYNCGIWKFLDPGSNRSCSCSPTPQLAATSDP